MPISNRRRQFLGSRRHRQDNPAMTWGSGSLYLKTRGTIHLKSMNGGGLAIQRRAFKVIHIRGLI
jgi:hypothetical protein